MSNSLSTYYSPILKPCFMGPQLLSKHDLEGTDIRGYFRNYRNGTISRIIIPSYSWNVSKKSYTPRPSSIMTFQDRLRSFAFPQNNISTIDPILMKEVDDLYTVVQAHRDQYKDHSSKLHPLHFFKTNKYKYQCASTLMPSYLKSIRHHIRNTKYLQFFH